MKCPNCEDSELRAVLTRQGVEVEHCDGCEGVWLDRGELFLFARKPKRVARTLDQALTVQTPTDKRSPPTGEPMVEITWPDGPRIDYCPRSGGLWFDAARLKALLDAESGVTSLAHPFISFTSRTKIQGASCTREAAMSASHSMSSLLIRSCR